MGQGHLPRGLLAEYALGANTSEGTSAGMLAEGRGPGLSSTLALSIPITGCPSQRDHLLDTHPCPPIPGKDSRLAHVAMVRN